MRAVETDPTDETIWLLLTALSAVYPSRGEVDETRRRIQLDSPMNLRMFLLDTALQAVRDIATATIEIDVIVGGVIVDVDHSAKHDLHTGIQRVARNLLPLWNASRVIIPAAWTSSTTALRTLDAVETGRILQWSQVSRTRPTSYANSTQPRFADADGTSPHLRVLVPWRSVVVMVEVPPPSANDRLAALGALSGNRLVGIAYDSIPIVSADAVPPVESMKFAKYLTALKFTSRMAGISAAATAEVMGFVRMLPTQGLVGPAVTVGLACRTPVPIGPNGTDGLTPATGAIPIVLSVGSHEPRKNHLAILFAAEILWREGLAFELVFIGGSGWGDEFPRLAADLKAAGRKVDVRRGVSDSELSSTLSSALFTVFPSLHEGYGLPVAESMAHGTPVITSNFGSMAEIASDGGALTIDPRSDVALTDAMRTLLTDPSEIERLRIEIANRPRRDWSEYATELWDAIVDPELVNVTSTVVDGNNKHEREGV